MDFTEFCREIREEIGMKAGLYQFWKQLKACGKTKLDWPEWYKSKAWESKKYRKK
jgi:hypothetical protein